VNGLCWFLLTGIVTAGIVIARLVHRVQQLREENARLTPYEQRVDEIKEKWLSHVSHEFRSPLASLIGYLDLMGKQASDLTPKHREYVKTMREGAQRLNSFVDNVLSLAKINSGLMTVSLEPVAVKDVLEQALRKWESRMTERKIVWRLQCRATLCVRADQDHLFQVLMQVVSNAIKFMPEGGHLTLWAREGGQRSIVMGVTDTGVGIPRAMFERVFQPFEQSAEVSKKMPSVKGGGLGLSIARRLLAAQNGQIWIEKSSSKGTTVSWSLPRPETHAVLQPVSEHRQRLAA
jgi:two-component system, cell cycle sensor histidine kinase PleC